MGLYNANEVITNEILSRHNVYGVTFDGVSSEGKPLYNAIDQKWVPATPTDPGVDTWKDLAPFNVKKCITDYDASATYKRKVLAYEGKDKYDILKIAKFGDRMVEFPLGYYYRPDPWTFIVSPDPIEGFKPSPACDLGNGTILNGFRLSEFDLCEVSSVPRSITGYKPWVNVSANEINDALKVFKGQYPETFGAWCWINILRLIKQQDLNSHKVNGMGFHNGKNTYVLTEDNIQGLDGYVGINDNDNVRTLGLQNFYGHVWNFLYNVLVRSDNKVLVNKDFIHANTWLTYYEDIYDGWDKLDIPLPGTANNSWISELAWNSTEPWALYPSKYGGNKSDPIGNGCWNDTNNPFSIVLVGGCDWNGSYGGALCWTSHCPFYIEDVSVGGRSLEIF